MVDAPAVTTDERPITSKDLALFEERIEQKLDLWRRELVAQLESKATPAYVDTQLRPIREQLDRVNQQLATTNLINAEIKGLLEGLKSINGDRVDATNKVVDGVRMDVELHTSAMAGLSESVSLIRRDLYGGDGDSIGLQQSLNRLSMTLANAPAQQAAAISVALEPLTERLVKLETTMQDVNRFISERRRIEAAALSIGKRAWKWATSRPSSTRWAVVITAGTLVGGWVADQPIGQIAELIIRRLVGLP